MKDLKHVNKNHSKKSRIIGHKIILDDTIGKNKIDTSFERIATESYGSLESAMHNDRLNRFNSRQGHGFAAEQANHQIDKIKGRDAVILGDDNAKNGADRMVDGQLIQTKYCQTAAESINAGFKNGQYRYLDATGKPMQIEVPLDQYDQAVKYMEQKIRKGEVPKITDPKDAVKLVRRGNVTFEQARNIAKPGNIDSLRFDANNGAVIGLSVGGISLAITYARALWSGQPINKAIDLAVYSGLQAGGTAFATSVLTAQVTRTSINTVMMKPAISLVNTLPSNVRHLLVNSMRGNAPIYGAAASNNLAKLLRGNMITTTVATLVMSAGDVYRFLDGRISGKQLFKNMTALGSGTFTGAITFTAISNPILATIAAGVAGTLGHKGVKKLLNTFIEDDAVEMVEIIKKCFSPLAEEYLLTEEELWLITEDLNQILPYNILLDMYASSDRVQYATDLLNKLIHETIKDRCYIRIPDQIKLTEGLGRVIGAALDGKDIEQSVMPSKEDIIKIGKAITGRELSEYTARKAYYVSRQDNQTLLRGEMILQNIVNNERKFKTVYEESVKQFNDVKTEFDKLIEELSHE